MIGLAVFAAIVLVIIFLIVLRSYLVDKMRKAEFADWQIDDVIEFWNSNDLIKVKAWSTDVMVYHEKDRVYTVKWSSFHRNRSAYWRRLNKECKQAMKTDKDVVDVEVTILNSKGNNSKSSSYSSSHPLLDGKAVELLTETECQVYLNLALQEEEFELAEAIKNRMVNFR